MNVALLPLVAIAAAEKGAGLDFASINTDVLEAILAQGPPMESESFHHFGAGLYIRETRFKAGTVGVSMEHKFAHPFFILTGDVEVVSDTEGVTRYTGPCWGMTQPGTRRKLFARTDTVWLTIHPNPDDTRDIELLANRLLEPHANPLVPEALRNQWRGNRNPVIE